MKVTISPVKFQDATKDQVISGGAPLPRAVHEDVARNSVRVTKLTFYFTIDMRSSVMKHAHCVPVDLKDSIVANRLAGFFWPAPWVCYQF